MNEVELKEFLDDLVFKYNHRDFIDADPIRIPHQFSNRQDIEIVGFLVATISWGNRLSILKSGTKLTEIMGNSPYDFVMSYDVLAQQRLHHFVHRTFNAEDLHHFFIALQRLYQRSDTLEDFFLTDAPRLQDQISKFRSIFFEGSEVNRSFKHVSDPRRNSAAKRINMFLRWMVRSDHADVDFGIWRKIKMSQLSCPLDVHSGGIARELGLLNRKQNDAKALELLDQKLRTFDAHDPVKYDFALFGLGVTKDWKNNSGKFMARV